MDAFFELSTCRQIGMGVGPIPFTAIVQYATIKGIEEDELDEFVYIIRKMDAEFLKGANAHGKSDKVRQPRS